MLNHYLTLFRRLLVRRQAYLWITSLGLLLGLTAVLLAFVFIRDEQGFDRFHADADRIFRVNKWITEPGEDRMNMAETPGLMAAALEADFPEVERAARYLPWFDEVLLSNGRDVFTTEQFAFADTNFLQLFDFELVSGRIEEVLTQPGQLVLTERFARRIFGKSDPMGRTLVGPGERTFTVSGILRDPPRQSHIQFDALASWASTLGEGGWLDYSFVNNWLGQTLYTYVRLHQAEQEAAVETKLPAFVARYMDNRVDRYHFYLQPLSEVYLHSHDLSFLRGGSYGNILFVKIFGIVALLILLIAIFNYVNISTAKSLQRAREVGVRKVMGAGRTQLLVQFLTETAALLLFITGLAWVTAYSLLPSLNRLLERELPADLLWQPFTLLFLLGVVVVASVLAGVFPAWLLSGFRPDRTLRTATARAPGGEWPRRLLTTSQLTISIALIAGALLVNQQFRYLLDKDLGIAKDQVLVLNTPPGMDSSAAPARRAIEALPGVKSVSMCQAAIGGGTFGTTVIPEGGNGEELMIRLFRVDTSFLATYGIELAAGRFFSGLHPTDVDPGALVVNETFVKTMGWDTYEGKRIRFSADDEEAYPVVGVVRDFHFQPLQEAITPIVMYVDGRTANISVRFDPTQVGSLLPALQQTWDRFEQRYPFDYYFVDQFFAENYFSERLMLRVISLFSAIAIFIACLGLYGLAAFSAARRTKELGIRKVLGASVGNLLYLLLRREVLLTAVAFVLATPLTYWFIQGWLERFAYRVPLHVWTFLAAGGIILLIATLVVLSQSLKAALANPVKALRSE